MLSISLFWSNVIMDIVSPSSGLLVQVKDKIGNQLIQILTQESECLKKNFGKIQTKHQFRIWTL